MTFVAVEEVVAGALVVADVDAAAELGEDDETDPPVLEVQRLPGMRLFHRLDPVVEREGVDLARGALIDPGLEECRVVLRLGREVGVDDHRLGPGGHGLLELVDRHGRQLEERGGGRNR